MPARESTLESLRSDRDRAAHLRRVVLVLAPPPDTVEWATIFTPEIVPDRASRTVRPALEETRSAASIAPSAASVASLLTSAPTSRPASIVPSTVFRATPATSPPTSPAVATAARAAFRAVLPRSPPTSPTPWMRKVKRGLDPDQWFNHVELVTAQKIGIETTTYVRNIYKYYVAYKLMLDVAEAQEKARTTVAPGK